MEEPVWLFPRQMPQLAPLSRRALATSRDEKVVTTLDAGLQRQLEDLALNWKSRLPPRSSLAVVVVDHTDMKVRSWVGSADITDDSRFGHIDMVSAVRSPGSVLKPLSTRWRWMRADSPAYYRMCHGVLAIIAPVISTAGFMAR